MSLLLGCDPRLVDVFERVVSDFDCTVLCGSRDMAAQTLAFHQGRSKLKYPESPHNAVPFSMAVDVAPYPIDWNDTDRFLYFGGFVLGVAENLDVQLRWGGDWNGDRFRSDQSFDDLVHFEILNWRDLI